MWTKRHLTRFQFTKLKNALKNKNGIEIISTQILPINFLINYEEMATHWIKHEIYKDWNEHAPII